MPDQKITVPSSQTATTANPSANGSAASGPPKVPGSRTDAQARIDELAAQKAHFQRKAQAFEGELSSLREEVAELRGRMSASQTTSEPRGGAPNSWESLSDGELENTIRWARENDKPEAVDRAYAERSRREAKRAADEAFARSKDHYERENYVREVRAQVLKDFGPDAFSKDSELFQAAQQNMAAFVQRYGKDAVQSRPDYLYDSFLRAKHQLTSTPTAERIKQLEDENAALSQRATLLEQGNLHGFAPPASDEVVERLKAKDTRGAIKGLKLFKSMTQHAQADALAKR